jgi:hypothetical protein
VIVVAGVAALGGVIGSACSSPSPRSAVASLPNHGGATTTTALTQQSADQGMISFSRCLRAHGVSEPDPTHVPGHTGLSVQIPARTASTGAALDACDHFLTPTIDEKQAKAAAITPARLESLTNYARCMRGHDINMLDPDQYGELNLGTVAGITSDFGRYSPQFRSADSACRHLLPAGVHDDGSGP